MPRFTIMSSKFLCTMTLIVILILLAACRKPMAEPLVFRYHLAATPVSLDPARHLSRYESGIIDRVFDGMLRLDRITNVLRPEIAESYSVSTDGHLYEFRLRTDAVFHNGRAVEAPDFKYSWERVLDQDTASPHAWVFRSIEGADAFQAGDTESVSGIEVAGPHLLRVRLARPSATFLYRLTHTAAAVVPREAVLRLGAEFGRQPVGAGPYQYNQWVQSHRVELAAFNGHFLHQPKVEILIFEAVPDREEALKMFETRNLDLITRIPEKRFVDLQKRFGSKLYTFSGGGWMGFCFRCDQAPFDDSRVRRSFSLAFDRDALVEELGPLHTAATGFIPQPIAGHDPATMTHGYDPDRARNLLTEAGYSELAQFPSVVYTTRLGDRKVTDFLIRALTDLGIETEHQTMDAASFYSGIRKHRFPFFRGGWSATYPDPEGFFGSLFYSDGEYNDFSYSNPEVDRLIEEAEGETDPKTRLELYQRVQNLVLGDAPCVVLAHRIEAVVLNPRWTNLPLGYLAEHLEIEKARLVEKTR